MPDEPPPIAFPNERGSAAKPPVRIRGPRPEMLTRICVISTAINVVGLIHASLQYLQTPNLARFLPLAVALFAVIFVVWWFVYNGKNWARLILLFWCGLSVLNIWQSMKPPWGQAVYFVLQDCWLAYVLWWLLQPEVKAYFIGVTPHDP
jgi:hypothetical protein